MAELSYSIHTGRWTDWSRGPVLGDQITLSSSNGQILIGFIAIFISFVGSQAWSILSFLLHQGRTLRKPRQGFEQQLQIMLRNLDSALAININMVRTGLAWRKTSFSGASQAFGIGILAAAIFIVFTAAGILLALIARSGIVLLKPSHCFNQPSPNPPGPRLISPSDLIEQEVAITQREQMSWAYASSCYSMPHRLVQNHISQPLSIFDCNKFVAPNISWDFQTGVPCPFAAPICRTDEPVIQLETEVINSNDVLGINMPPQDQVEVQARIICAPLNETGYTTTRGDTKYWHFGHHRHSKTPLLQGNETFHSSTTFPRFASDPFPIQVVETPLLSLIPQITKKKATTALIFLSNLAFYIGRPVKGFWFGADQEDEGYYRSSRAGDVAGCTQQVRYCNPAANGRCVPYHALRYYEDEIPNRLKSLGLNEKQLTTISRYLGGSFDITTALVYGRSSVLDVNQYRASQRHYLQVPSTQWQIEFARLFSIALAGSQVFAFQASLFYAGNISKLAVNDGDLGSFCNSFKVYNKGYLSFPVLWLGLIFGLGGLVLVVAASINFVLPHCQAWLGKKWEMARNHWDADDLLQLIHDLDEK